MGINMNQFIEHVERILLQHVNGKHCNNIIMQSVHHMIEQNGNISMKELESGLHISNRQIERLFNEYIGVSPKMLASLIRYQLLWKDIVCHQEYVQMEFVYKYGYSDQSHMHHDFKKYHGMNISDARRHALEDVGNLQDLQL